ncbi:hypothetical protein [Carnobacterium maltaromaticum]|uniref:hypothetical protein n=1 Tax=Carnobacterium maltaromaticum TaxID=2751 RepID=UPI0012F9D77A|nr:hypothetical protein [Carnobacterium maltaromaticum]
MKIDLKKWSVEGCEINIRLFYFHFFWEQYKNIEWPFDSINREKLIQDTTRIIPNLLKFMTELESEHFLYWLAIAKIRESKGHLLCNDPWNLSESIIEANLELEEILIKILKTDSKHKVYLEATYLNFLYTLTTESLLLKEQLLIDLEKSGSKDNVYKIVVGLMDLYKEHFPFKENADYKNVLFSLYKLFIYETYLGGIYRKYLWRDCRAISNSYLGEFKELYLKSIQKSAPRYCGNEYLYHSTLFLCSLLVDEQTYRPEIIVKFLCNDGKVNEMVLGDTLKCLFQTIKIANSLWSDVDIIVTDYSIDKSWKEKTFYWSSNPTEEDWRRLIKKIEELEWAKANHYAYGLKSKQGGEQNVP